jgi:hypothetical protein
MDEEGFMMDIERFTKQEIPVQVIEGFGPEEAKRPSPSPWAARPSGAALASRRAAK